MNEQRANVVLVLESSHNAVKPCPREILERGNRYIASVIQIPAQPLLRCVTWGVLFNCSVPWFSHLQNLGNNGGDFPKPYGSTVFPDKYSVLVSYYICCGKQLHLYISAYGTKREVAYLLLSHILGNLNQLEEKHGNCSLFVCL